MQFNEHKPIFLQVADTIISQILLGEIHDDDRIPSVRDLGQSIGVNPNTIVRSYEYLQNAGLIYNKRGLGYFVCEDAKKAVLTMEREQFIKSELPTFFKRMRMLGISLETITQNYYQENNDEKDE